MQKRVLKILLIVLVVSLNLGADQLTKELARHHIKGHGTIQVIGNFFVLKYAENCGAFLGLGSALSPTLNKLFLILVPVLMLIGCFFYIFHQKDLSRVEIISLASVIGGGLSNVIDRIFNNGAVTDFLNFGVGSLRTGILNVADLSITFGVLVFIVAYYLKNKKEKTLTASNPE